mmetsp:Transcript_114968/g.332206  ORF Transcript_114968/g.332206 Transcript_114968/m.332206 type:complete len:514 (-) Transcript_114968:256-1797(-)|eukprot:CAMPEP_0176012124 /NCGR_PEP_ID=MMETSP0120_2-20121206/5635_1 /TAXON_ID=160619 /ORGANISM="Kryptoperidinium foliaceum, Strain CCMP 1326" /LENGTH=513 /DNA_ID=CAMNT_0017345003 /DNA_START=115 /DNA_END=1656 /DNA_ORIENTATION=-
MPRGQRETFDSSREGEMSCPVTRSRRALGDVSNKGAEDSEAPKKARRSSRLSNGPAEADANPAEDTATLAASRRRSLRSSSVARATKATAVNPLVEPAPKSRCSRKRTSRTTDDSARDAKPPAARTKRQRTSDEKEAEERRNSLRSRSSRSERKSGTADAKSSIGSFKPKFPCHDLLNTGNHSLRREPFTADQYMMGIGAHDMINQDDPLHVSDYVTDIFQRLFNAESDSHPNLYMDRQPELNSMMRSILVDWLVEVHMKFRLMPESLYLCVNIIDRYLECTSVKRSQLQLVGVTALLVACKYEEIYPPEVKDCVYITDRAYTRQNVLDMEAEIVKKLQFHLTVPTGYPFLQRFLHITNATTLVRNLSNYYMERMLQEHSSLAYRPSLLAAAAVTLAHCNPDRLDYDEDMDEGHYASFKSIRATITEYTGFGEEEIHNAATLIEEKVGEATGANRSKRRPLVAIRRKFETSHYGHVATAYTAPKASYLSKFDSPLPSAPSECSRSVSDSDSSP